MPFASGECCEDACKAFDQWLAKQNNNQLFDNPNSFQSLMYFNNMNRYGESVLKYRVAPNMLL